MPLYDVNCPCCNETEEVMLKVNEEIPECPKCKVERVKVCNCTHFKLMYNNKTDICAWSDQGYASSQYYRHVNK